MAGSEGARTAEFLHDGAEVLEADRFAQVIVHAGCEAFSRSPSMAWAVMATTGVCRALAFAQTRSAVAS